MLKIGITETAYTDCYGYEAGVRRMAEHGYQCMDYHEFVDTETPLFEKSPKEFEGYLREQRRIAEDAGLEIFQAHGPWRWPPRDYLPEERAERLEKLTRSIEGTAVLGCKRIVYHPIMPFGRQDEDHADETWNFNLEFMSKAVEVAGKNGVILCLENMPWPEFSLSDISETLQLVQAVDSPYFKVCLDTGHCATVGRSPAEAVRIAGKEYLETMHIHDNDGKRDLHMMPFTKKIDFEEFGRALHDIGFEGVLSLESLFGTAVPPYLREMEEKLLVEKIRYIARLARGED